MQVFIAVLDDLFRFAIQSLFGSVSLPNTGVRSDDPTKPLQPLLPLLPARRTKIEVGNDQTSPGSYYVSVKDAAVRLDPVASFDNVILTLPFGTQLNVVKYGGRWAMAQIKEITGWILKDDIDSSATIVFPRFSVGSVYDAEHESTRKVRAYIDDEFHCTEPALPLTAAEYATYRLKRTQRVIHWPQRRPRLPGQWQVILRGNSSVHLGVIPKTASLMEYIEEDQGYLLYVEAVFPDKSIQVSAVDYEGQGVYSESVLPKEVWRELRPIFIEVM